MKHDTTKSTFDVGQTRTEKKHNERGEEIIDPTPMQPPLGYKKSLSLSEQIAQQVRIAHLKILEDSAIDETEDDADDFEVGDDFEPLSPHENEHMPTLANLKKQANEINNKIKAAQTRKAIEEHKKRIASVKAKNEPAPEAPEPETSEETEE